MAHTHTAAVYTLGCKVNQYESEAISEALQKNGVAICDFSRRCDCYVINTCAVTAESVRKARQIIRRAKKTNPDAYVLVTGCAAQLDASAICALGVDYVCGTRNKMSVVLQALNLMESGTAPGSAPVISVREAEGEIEPMQITHFERTRAYVKIQDGCNAHCAYCIIPKVRGDVTSRTRDDVISEVRRLAAGGCPEVVLTGIETSAYAYDLSRLLSELEEVDGLERIRLSSLDPSFMRQAFVDRIARLHKTVPHFHLSVQAGCDRTLARMRRKYNCEIMRRNIAYLRECMPQVLLSADIITGFPGESEEDFADTLRFAEEIGFLHIHIFTYSVRPGTEAAEMPDQVPESVKIQRSHRLAEVDRKSRASILGAAVDCGMPLSVLVETEEDGYLRGHTPNFMEVRFRAEAGAYAALHGRIVSVLPLCAEENCITGVLQSNGSACEPRV